MKTFTTKQSKLALVLIFILFCVLSNEQFNDEVAAEQFTTASK